MADLSEPDQPVAGPSRLSPRQSSPRLPLYTEDVTMEMKSGVIESGPHSQEAAELLLGFSTIEPRLDEPPAAIPPPLDPPSPGIPHTYIDPPKLVSERQTFPYTPPDDPPSHVQIESAQPSSPADPSLPPKPRQKRKRALGNTPNRRTSTDPARPPHFMGEDNEVIRCICGIDEDDGLTIQCESCYAWQHALCFGYADAESAPEIYYCELCAPRSFDGEFARERQVIAKGKRDNRVSDPSQPAIPGEKKPRGKAKRARVGSVHEDPDQPDKDPSPGTMAPPSTKPRRKPGPKPKPKVIEPSPAPSYTYIPPPTDAEDDYFRVEPWSLEYTPVRDNVIRGREARRVLSRMYREWVDIEEEEKRRSMGPSGLPSPTETGLIHLSPDLFPLPDFSILAPPVPPVPLLGPDLDSLASPTIIKSISPSLSFLPLSYSEATPLAGPYHRPALYGVFSSAPITSKTFIGEHRSEVIDSETYRLDPINQYSILGMLKPHVHPIGPPVNLMLDSRGYGSELRFIRSGCHPNVVLRPFLFRVTESDAPKLRFGVFASRDISPEEELVLGWTWDDSHLVHSLRSHLHPTILPDGYPGRPLTPPPPALLDKFESVLTHFLGTFSSCACRTLGNCAIAQMRFLVEIRDEPFGEVGQRANLGLLVGATRGWRRGEEEKEKVRRWNLLDLENGWETVRRQRPEKVVQGVEEVVTLEEVIVDSREETEDVGTALEAEMDEVMESASEAEEGEGEPEEAVEVVSQSPLPNGLPSPVLGPSRQAPSTPPRPATADAVSPHSEPASPATSRLSTPPPARARSSPQLGSQSGSGEDEQDEEVDDDAGVDGNESDATTATVPRSPSDVDMDEPDLRRSTSPSPRSKPKLDSLNKRQYNTTRPTSTSRRQSESSSDSSEPDTAPAPVTSRRDPSRPYKISRFRKDGKEDKRFKSRPAVVSPAGSVAPKRQKKRIISSPITEDDSAEVRVNGKHTGEDIAASLFPEVKEVVNEETGQEGNPPTPPPPLIPNPPRKSPTPPLMPNPPPKSPTPPPRKPTPPPEPAKKVSISEWLRKRNEEKIERDRQMAANHAKEGVESQVQAAVETKEEVKAETAQEGQGFNIHDFLPSSRPSQEVTGSYGSTLYESPQIANVTPNGAYIPRTEYFPTTTPRNSSYVPRASVSTDSESAPRPAYVPRAVSTPVEEPQPLPEPNGHAPEEYGGYLASRAARSVSVTIPPLEPGSSSSPEGTSQDEPSSMPPPLAYREPPPHQQPPRSYPSASLSPETRTTVLASPSERTSPLPRLPPTGPKAVTAPTGPRGVWPTPVTTTGERSVSGGSNGPTTPITPTAPSGPRGPVTHVPVPGMGGRGGFGGRGMFEPRASWRGRHFGTRGGWR